MTMTENKPILIKDILGDPSHPAHSDIKAFSEKVNSGEISVNVCACIGPVYGEPHCACEMRRRGLPPSAEHVAALEKANRELAELFGPGGKFSGA